MQFRNHQLPFNDGFAFCKFLKTYLHFVNNANNDQQTEQEVLAWMQTSKYWFPIGCLFSTQQQVLRQDCEHLGSAK